MDIGRYAEQLWCTMGYQEAINFCMNRIDEGCDPAYYEEVMQELDYIFDDHYEWSADDHYDGSGHSE